MTEARRYDLHMHSRHSYDCMMSPKGIVRAALKRGLSGIAVTDHGTIAGGIDVAAVAPRELLVIVGAEIYTTVGDIVCLFLTKEIVGRDPLDVIAQTREQGGVAFFPHPLRSHPKGVPSAVLDAVVGYEVLNARAGPFAVTDAPQRETDWRPLRTKAVLANSDAHLYSEIGAAYTIISGPATAENVKAALCAGHTTAAGARVPPRNFYVSQLIKMVKTRDAKMLMRFGRRLLRLSPARR
jgi:predicted metal-dependent phosphoesterase TrpH